MEKIENTQDLTDEEIVKKIIEGDSFLFECIVDRYFDSLMRYGRKFITDKEDIKDSIQEIFIKVFENIKKFDTSRSFKPWIYRVAHNVYVNHLRFSSRIPYIMEWDTFTGLSVKDEKYETEKENKTIKEELEVHLSKISPAHREVLTLYYLEEMSYKEVSEVLHIPINSVGVRISRAKKELRSEIDKNEKRN